MKLDTINCSTCAILFAQVPHFKSQLESTEALYDGIIIASPLVLFSPQPFSIAEILCLFVCCLYFFTVRGASSVQEPCVTHSSIPKAAIGSSGIRVEPSH